MEDQAGNASTRSSDPLSTGKRRQLLPRVNDSLTIGMESSKKRTIEETADGKEEHISATRRIWPLKLKNTKII